jgi:hypothetical protein
VYECLEPSGCPAGFVLVSWDGAPEVCSRICTGDTDCPGSFCALLSDGSFACAPTGDPGGDADADADSDPCSGAMTQTVTRTESGSFEGCDYPDEHFFNPPCVEEREDWDRIQGIDFTLTFSTGPEPVTFSVIYAGQAIIYTGAVTSEGTTLTASAGGPGPNPHLFVHVNGGCANGSYELTGVAQFHFSVE